MSVISQFFPSGTSGGGGGGSSSNIGGGTVPVEIVGMAGGGGGGGGCSQPACTRIIGGGGGGQGGFFYAKNYYLNPGTTYPITIGGGGSGGPSGTRGSNGTHTAFNNPLCPIRVEGGGGGGAGLSPYGCFACRNGLPGGSGGGAGGGPSGCVGEGLYFSKSTTVVNHLNRSLSCVCNPSPIAGSNIVICMFDNNIITMGENNTCPWGYMAGFPGAPCYSFCAAAPSCIVCGGNGGTAVTNYVNFCNFQPYSNLINATALQYGSNRTYSNITGINVGYGVTVGCGGEGSPCSTGTTGLAGALVIKWPSTVGAAPPSGFPGGTDLSPLTPGYFTYCFTSSGSITLP